MHIVSNLCYTFVAIQRRAMVNRIYISILFILFFVTIGRVDAWGKPLVLKEDIRVKQDTVIQKCNWLEVYQWITADAMVPDREEVLMLMRYHYSNPDKMLKLLRYMDSGKPYAYLSRHIFPIVCRKKKEDTLHMAALPAPQKTLLSATILPGKATERPVQMAAKPERTTAKPVTVTVKPEKAKAKPEKVDLPAVIAAQEEKQTATTGTTVVALKNNILYDLALAPNVEIEVPVGRRWSLNAEYKCPWWSDAENSFCYQLLSGGLEVRYWLGDRYKRNRLTGHFFGVYAEGGTYDFQFREEKGFRGDNYMAAGFTYGYTLQLLRHMAIEFSLGIGYLETEYRQYTTYGDDLVWTSSGRYHFIGPTKAKVSLIWLISKRR